MTPTATLRKQTELDDLLNAHRLVKATLPFGIDIMECVAPLDIPEINVEEGGVFWLATSSFEGFCYRITRIDLQRVCPCKSAEHNHGSCKHSGKISAMDLAKWQALAPEREEFRSSQPEDAT